MKKTISLFLVSLLYIASNAYSVTTIDSTDLIFKDDIVHSYELQYYVENWQDSMLFNKTDNDEAYMGARFIYRSPNGDSIILDSIGVRYKGNSSFTLALNKQKKSFKVSFDHYRDNVTFFGCKKLNLNNCIEDPSYMREKLGYDIIAKYTPAPRVAYAKLSINGNFIGVYAQVEQIDKDFLKRHFDKSGGSLFKPADNGAEMFYKGPNVDDYVDYYELKENKKDDNPWGHFITMLYYLNDTLSGNTGIVTKSKEHLDFTNCIWHIAWTMVLSHFDSYTGSGRNYYLYDDPSTNKFFMLPWDVNMAFGQFPLQNDIITNNAFVPDQLDNRPLLKAVLQNDSLKRVYINCLREMIAGPASAEKVAAEADRIKSIIAPVIEQEPAASRFYTYEQFLQNIDSDITIGDEFDEIKIVGIKSFSAARNAELHNQIVAGVLPGSISKNKRTTEPKVSCSYNNRNAIATINYTPISGEIAVVSIYTSAGVIVDRLTTSNAHNNGSVQWNGAAVTPGIYLVSLTGRFSSVSSKLIVFK